MGEELETPAQLVELLDHAIRPYKDVWGATVHFAQQGIVDQVGYWLGLYRIKRDASWRDAGYETQEDWLDELCLLSSYEGGCVRSVFFDKVGMIESLVDKGVTDRMIVHALTQPTATKTLLKNVDKLPEGSTVQTVLEETEDMNPTQGAKHAAEVVGLKPPWIGELRYDMKKQVLVIPICEEDEQLNLDVRKYPVYGMSFEDATFMSKTLRKHMEVT